MHTRSEPISSTRYDRVAPRETCTASEILLTARLAVKVSVFGCIGSNLPHRPILPIMRIFRGHLVPAIVEEPHERNCIAACCRRAPGRLSRLLSGGWFAGVYCRARRRRTHPE